MDLLGRTWYGNPLSNWLIAIGIAAGLAALVWGLGRYLVIRFRRVAKRTSNGVDDLLAEVLTHTRFLLLFVLSARLAALTSLVLPRQAVAWLDVVSLIVFVLQVGVWGHAAIRFWIGRFRDQHMGHGRASVTTVTALGLAGQILLWSAVVLVVLDNLGVNITALVAGLGITGVAVALATQNILSDLFSSLAIVLDRPFVLGDFIVVDQYMGTVERIGIKTTRVRSLSGEQIVFSNGDLIAARIRNFGTLFERRVVLTIRVPQHTGRDKLRRIPALLKEAVLINPKIRFDRSHWSAIGDSWFEFETVYYLNDPDYNLFMDLQQQIFLGIHERFEREGVEFAVPARRFEVTTLPADGKPPDERATPEATSRPLLETPSE